MDKKLWTFITYLFHPALMPTLGAFAVLYNDPTIFSALNTEKPWIIVISVVFLCTYVLPLFFSWVLYKLARVSSISSPTESDRKTLLSATALFYLLAYYCFHNIVPDGQSLKIFLLGINITLIITLITSLFTRVSFHGVGAGGLLGTIIGLMHYTHELLLSWLTGAFAIVIVVGLSRYKLKVHGAFEVYVGLIIGITIQSLVFFFGIQGA